MCGLTPGPVSRGRRAVERRYVTLSVLVAALARHSWANRVAGRDRAGREPQVAIRQAPEKWKW